MKILIVKLGAIGDVIMAMPLVGAIRRRDPRAEIVWMCGEATAPLVAALDRVEPLVVSEAALLGGSAARKIRAVCAAWRRLLGRRFDLIITGYSDRRYRLLSLAARARERRGFDRGGGRWWPTPGRYHGDEYARLFLNRDGPETGPAELPQIDVAPPPELRATLAGLGRGVIALAPGGARNALGDSPLRRWPLASYARLAAELARRGWRIALTGAASDGWTRAAFEKIPVVDLIGKTALIDLIAVYRACGAVVTHDSGPMHLAILAGAPTVALFGPTLPSEKVPRSEKIRVLHGGAGLPCRPCYDGRTYAPCRDNRCLGEIAPAAVADAVEELIGPAAVRAPGRVSQLVPGF